MLLTVIKKYVTQAWNILNFKGYPNCIIGSQIKAFLLIMWILPAGGVASERVCAQPVKQACYGRNYLNGKKINLIYYTNICYQSLKLLFN